MRAAMMLFASSLALASFAATAGGNGRINFSGAVVAPTCTVQAEVDEGAMVKCEKAGTRYARKVAKVDQAQALGNQLLDYWAEHAPRDADGKPDATLELRTYL